MGWLIACVLAVSLWWTRRRLKRLMRADPARSETESARSVLSSYSNVPSAYRLLHNLIVLRLELQRLQAAEELDTARYADLTAHIDTLSGNIVRSLGTSPQSQPWQQARDVAWEWLAAKQALLGPPPWAREDARATPDAAALDAEALTPPAHLHEALVHRVEVPPAQPPAALESVPPSDQLLHLVRHASPAQPPAASEPVPPPLTVPTTAAAEFDAAGESVPPAPAISPSSPEETASYAWEPAAPGALERALQAVSGWPALLAPFLVQNIGWFIGGSCFVAGSIFLVAYTTGFAKTLASFAVLAVYTLLLLWGGYQIRRRRPALEMSSSALLIFGMLLVPLNVAAAVRLILVAQRSLGLMALGLLAAVVGVVGLYVSATLVSGVMDRTLQRQHPRLFLALAAIQLALPLLAQWPVWPLLLLCHGVVVGLLAYGFVLFTHDWLHSIFIERRKLAYYAAGTLVYAALVSFVHLTWGYQGAAALPPGYYGPWLMVLCGLLFYVDTHLKQWEGPDGPAPTQSRQQHAAFLSQVSFGIYGLSVMALLLAVQGPLALLCTLALAVVLYGFVTWQYATLPPLYLLLGCAGWFYHEVVLQHFSDDLYFLASLPGFASLWAATWWALRHRATALALVGYRVLGVALLSVAAWSIVPSQPGWAPLATAVLVMGFAFAAPRAVPTQVLGRSRGDGTRTAQHIWLYFGTGAGVVAAAYAPGMPGLVREVQFAWGLFLLAAVWTALGLRLSRITRADTTARGEALLNSAVLYLGVCLSVVVLLALPDLRRHRVLPLLLGLEGGIALWLSLTLGVQWLFYGVLGLWGAAGVIVKLTYFPAAGSGATVIGIGLLIWVVLWWLEHAPAEVTALRQERVALRAARAASLTLLGLYPVAFSPPQAVVRVPLRQAMVLLWGLGITHLVMRLLAGSLGWDWVVSASLGALLAGLLTGSLPWPGLLPVSMTLGWGAVRAAAGELGVTTVGGLSVISAVYAVLVWQLGVTLLSHPAMGRFALLCHLQGNRTRLEGLTHWTAFIITALSISMPLAHYGVFVPSVAMVLTLGTGMAFWYLAGQRYQYGLHRYLVLESGALGIVLGYVWMFHTVSMPRVMRWQMLLSAPGLGLTCVLLSVGLWGMAWIAWRHPETEEVSLRRAEGAWAGEFLLYHRPLQVVAVQLALIAAVQSLGLVMPAVIGEIYTGGFFALAVLGLAGMSLLCATQAGFHLLGLLGLVLAVLGTQSVWFHGTPVSALWFGQPMYMDQWFTLAVLALVLASLAQYVGQAPRWAPRYTRPLYVMATLTYGWALLGAIALFGLLPGQAAAVAWVFLVLALGLLPLAQPLPGAAHIRGLGMALLLSASVISALAGGGWHTFERLLLVVWAYVLWSLGNFALPRYNARWPRWTIAPAAWPRLGLLLVCSALLAWGVPWHPEAQSAAWRLGGYLTAVALYLFLLLRNSAWGGWPWLAVGALTWAGLAFQAAWLGSPASWLALWLPLLGVTLLSHPAVGRVALLYHLRGNRIQLEGLTHWTAFAMTVWSIGMALAHYGVFVPSLAMALTLGTGMAFWCLAGQRYQYRLHRYLVLESGALGIVLGYVWVFHTVAMPRVMRWEMLLSAPGLGLTCVLLSVGLWGMAWIAWRHSETAAASPHCAAGAWARESLLYHEPLQVVAVQLALMAAVQSLGLVLPAVLGEVYTGGYFALAVLGLAGMSLLCAAPPGFHLAGLLGLVLAVLGIQSVWLHGTPVSALWFGQPVYMDQWFTLAVLALGLASLAHVLRQAPRWAWRYIRPLYVMATLTYGWALLGAMGLFGLLPLQAAAVVAWTFLVLALGLVPLAQPLAGAAYIRGLGMALLLSTSVLSALAGGGWHLFERLLVVVWAYVLWGLGNFALPRYNARWPRWTIAPHAWPWLGLLLLCGALLTWGVSWQPEPQSAALRLGVYLTAVALYLFLLLRNSTWGGWPWLAVGTLTWAGLAFQTAWLGSLTSDLALWPPLVAPVAVWREVGGAVVWANILLLGVTAWRRYGSVVALRLGWQAHDLCMPLLIWPAAVLSACLLYLGLWDASAILVHAWAMPGALNALPAVLLGLLLSASFFHVAWLHSARWSLHGCIAALFCTALAVWYESVAGVLHPPLFIALWSVLLVSVVPLGARWQWPAEGLAAVRVWRNWSPLLAVLVWILFPYAPFAEHLVILGLLGGYAAGLGWQRQHSVWLFVALMAGVIQLHGWWLVWLAPQHMALLWPWYTLQLAGLTWCVLWVQDRLRLGVETDAAGPAPTGWLSRVPAQPLAQALVWLLPLLVALTLLTWTLHLLHVLDALIAHQAPQWLLGWGEGVVAVLAVVVLMAAGIRQARRTAPGWCIYGIAVLGGTVSVYVRVLWVGLAPLQVWDTVVLIGASYVLFILQRLTQSTPLLHVVVLLPLLAVATAPLQLASVHTSGALLTVAMLYLAMRQSTGRVFPLYMGLLALNVGIYLWVPGWAYTYHLLQIYTIPAAVSVLWLLHAHRHELRPSVLHSLRLAATSILYVSATLDVFLRSEVTIFVAALALSLGGIIIGIALRTRAFLYASTSFFVLNIIGQLILFFPEQRLTRAIVLLVLGTLITGLMIWFNIQRETVLQRIRIFRADLATWA